MRPLLSLGEGGRFFVDAGELAIILRLVDQATADLKQAKQVLKDLGDESATAAAQVDKLDASSGTLNKTLGNLAQSAVTGVGAFLGYRAVDTVMTGVGQAFDFVKSSAIGMNSDLETAALQFETLMGSASEAEKHVADLFEFAERTPFETAPIIEASRLLETFGGEALNTTEQLTRLGDASAATSGPINELGFWTGRLYSQLESGKPFGEAAMRLQELAVLSPTARAEMEALQAAGASSAEVFRVFEADLDRFSGAMERQAGTWAGLRSTLTDSLALAASQGLKPFFELAKDGLDEINRYLGSAEFDDFANGFAASMQVAADGVRGLISTVRDLAASRDFAEFASTMQGVGDIVLDVTTATGRLSVVVGKELVPAVGDVIVGLEPIVTGLQSLIDTIEAIPTPDEQKTEDWRRFWEGVADGSTGASEAMANWAVDLLPRVNDGSLELLDGLIRINGVFGDIEEATRSLTTTTDDNADATQRQIEYQRQNAEMSDEARAAVARLTDTTADATLAYHRHNQVVEDSGEGLTAWEVHMLNAAAATYDVQSALSGLEGAYQAAGDAANIFNQQSSEYGQIASTIEAARDALIERQQQNIDLTMEEQRFLENYPQIYDRVTGAQDDATIQAGLFAGSQVDVMLAQDDAAASSDNLVSSVGDANAALADAQAQSGLTTDGALDLAAALSDVGIELGNLDGQSATLALNLAEGGGVGTTAGARGGATRFEQRAEDLGITGRIQGAGAALADLDGSSAEVTATVDDVDARTDLEWIENTKNRLDGSGFVIVASVDTSAVDRAVQYIDDSLPHSPAKRGPLSREPDWRFLFGTMPAAAGAAVDETVRNIGAEFDILFAHITEGWGQVVTAIQHDFTGPNIVDIMTGEAASNLEQDIAALQAYMDALLEAGFAPDSPEMQALRQRYQELMQELALVSEIAGTDAAKEYWREWADENLPKSYMRGLVDIFEEFGITAGEYFAEAFWDEFASGPGRPGDGSGSIIDKLLNGDDEPIGVPIEIEVRARDIGGDEVTLVEGVQQIAEEALAELARIFAEYPEVAVGMVDDLVQAVVDGRLPFEEAMRLLAMIPEDDLIPALERLEEQLTVDLAEALLKFGPNSPEVQAILQALQAIEAAASATDDAISQIPDSLANLPGSKGYQAPGDQSPGGVGPTGSVAPVGGFGGLADIDALTAQLAGGARLNLPADQFRQVMQALQATVYLDDDGLYRPDPGGGFTLYGSPGDYYVNPYGPNGGQGGGGDTHIYIDGREVTSAALQHLRRETPVGTVAP